MLLGFLMQNTVRKLFVLLGLLCVFLAPGGAAWLFYRHPGWLHATNTNKGQLLSPSLRFKGLDMDTRWGIMLWNPGLCGKACLDTVDQLSRVRLALGRQLYQVRVWVVSDAPLKVEAAREKTWNAMQVQTFSVLPADRKALPQKPAVFIADPAGYWILHYGQQTLSADVFHDMKKLLTISSGSKH